MAVAFLAFGDVQAADIISGVPRVVDGDTIEIGSTKIRLESIDAPETDQACLDAHEACWKCGIEARDRLKEHIADRSIDCASNGSDRYGRTLAACSIGGEDLNAWMVQQGWALAFVRYSNKYVADEATAREAQRGMWSGAFIAPWDYRHRGKETIIHGALQVPLDAQRKLLAPCETPDCNIKGNLNRKGERIYFLPGQPNYSKVNMDKPGTQWFCTEDAAKAAGWRPAAR